MQISLRNPYGSYLRGELFVIAHLEGLRAIWRIWELINITLKNLQALGFIYFKKLFKKKNLVHVSNKGALKIINHKHLNHTVNSINTQTG